MDEPAPRGLGGGAVSVYRRDMRDGKNATPRLRAGVGSVAVASALVLGLAAAPGCRTTRGPNIAVLAGGRSQSGQAVTTGEGGVHISIVTNEDFDFPDFPFASGRGSLDAWIGGAAEEGLSGELVADAALGGGAIASGDGHALVVRGVLGGEVSGHPDAERRAFDVPGLEVVYQAFDEGKAVAAMFEVGGVLGLEAVGHYRVASTEEAETVGAPTVGARLGLRGNLFVLDAQYTRVAEDEPVDVFRLQAAVGPLIGHVRVLVVPPGGNGDVSRVTAVTWGIGGALGAELGAFPN